MTSDPAPVATHTVPALRRLVIALTEYGDFGKWPCDYFTHDRWLVHADTCPDCLQVKARWQAERDAKAHALWQRVQDAERRWAA